MKDEAVGDDCVEKMVEEIAVDTKKIDETLDQVLKKIKDDLDAPKKKRKKRSDQQEEQS